MSVIQAKGLCWEVISYFFSGILPCADPSTEGLGIMRGLEGLPFHAAQSTQPTSLENNIFLTFLAIGRTWDKHDIPDISWVLTRCKLQLLGLFAFFLLFVCSFPRELQGPGFRGGGCKCVGAVWTMRATLVYSIWLQWPSCSVVTLPGNEVTSWCCGCTHAPPAVAVWAERYLQIHCRLEGAF